MPRGDQVAVIVGGSSGIGRATAIEMSGRGAKVVCLARGRDRLEATVRELGSNATGIVCDATDPAAVGRAFTQIERDHGRIDALFNVLGVGRATEVEEATDDDIATVIGTNLLAPIYTTRAAIPLLRRAAGGDIVNISSEVTMDLFPLFTLYSTAKAGLEMFTKSMTKELKNHDIRVTLFIAGRTKTGFQLAMSPERAAQARAVWEADGCMQRVAGEKQMDAAWVAEAIVFAATRPRDQIIDVMRVRAAR